MARYEHLHLVRLPERIERRKRQFFGSVPRRDPAAHSAHLTEQLEQAVDLQRRRRRPEFVDPSLILRVRMTGALLEEEWEQLGLTVLSSDPDRTLVLFASSDEMREFRARLDAYGGEKPAGQIHPAYVGFVAAIEAIGSVEPRDRIGKRLRGEGFSHVDEFVEDREYLLDLELWDLGQRELRQRTLESIARHVVASGGQAIDQYIGPSITMLRLRATGAVVRTLLAIEEVASIDLPPQPDVVSGHALDLALGELPLLGGVAHEAPLIGIIDSGVNAHPLIEDILAGVIAVPPSLGTADDFGHGTRIAGIATLGDVRAQLANQTLLRAARLCAAKVLNEHGRFDDRMLVPAQMRTAVTQLRRELGCRIFVIALGDRKLPYDGGKVGSWAATLDELVRELDIVIIVSAGNRDPRSGEQLEEAVTEYPRYLTEDENRIIEPAGALNVVTVGSLAHGEGLDEDRAKHAHIRPVTKWLEPSPFSRIGPGVGGAIKPDVVDLGGTLVYDPGVMRLLDGKDAASAGMLTLHHRPIDRLFTAGSGTSYAAPLVAYKASQLLTLLPEASANLIRALLAGAAEIPSETRACLTGQDEDTVRAICGHGLIDSVRAAYSDDARVVLYAEDELPTDHFAVYEVPIPEAFQIEQGTRTVRVTLAYDPPVRHTRIDYAGVALNFRLLRGCTPEFVFDHYKKRAKEDGPFPTKPGRYDCALKPGAQVREKGTLQTASITFQRDISDYGDRYYLVVRCEAGWARIDRQRYAIAVELAHSAEIRLYERLRVRVRG